MNILSFLGVLSFCAGQIVHSSDSAITSDDLYNELKELKNEIHVVNEKNGRLEREVVQLQTIVLETNEKTQQDLNGLKSQQAALSERVQKCEIDTSSSDKYTENNYGCTFENVTLTCPGDKTINVTLAHYGQYVEECNDGCCPPDPDDCIESVEENAPLHWDVLLAACNNQTTCVFENPGFVLQSCAPPYTSNYLSVYYSCLPEEVLAAVGFTAIASNDAGYNDGDIVAFDMVETNLGGFYDNFTSMFLCPYNGVYVFSVSTRSYTNFYMYARIIHNNRPVAGTATDEIANDQGSVLAVIECSNGEGVWVENYGDNKILGGSSVIKYSSFSGFLLHAYQ